MIERSSTLASVPVPHTDWVRAVRQGIDAAAARSQPLDGAAESEYGRAKCPAMAGLHQF